MSDLKGCYNCKYYALPLDVPPCCNCSALYELWQPLESSKPAATVSESSDKTQESSDVADLRLQVERMREAMTAAIESISKTRWPQHRNVQSMKTEAECILEAAIAQPEKETKK